eukprot:409522-Hanusia_phi.AAC.1
MTPTILVTSTAPLPPHFEGQYPHPCHSLRLGTRTRGPYLSSGRSRYRSHNLYPHFIHPTLYPRGTQPFSLPVPVLAPSIPCYCTGTAYPIVN